MRTVGVALLLTALFVAPAQAVLVAHWPFEEGAPSATTENVVPSSHDTLAGPAWIAAGPVPGGSAAALDFSGGNNQVNVTDGNKGVIGNADRTVSAWVRLPVGSPGDQDIISWGNNANAQKWVFRVQDDHGPVDGTIRVEVNGGFVVGNQDLRDGQWHHVAASFANDGSPNVGDVRLYVDGQLQIPTWQSNGINTASGNDVIIGSETWNTGRPLEGDMDDLRIYDEALDVDAVRALAGVAPTGIDTAPAPAAAYNAYNDDDGDAVWENETALGRTPTSANYNLIGDVARVVKPATSLLNLHGAYAFDGTGDEGRLVGNPQNFLNGDITHISAALEIWFKPSDLTGNHVLWEIGGNGDGSSFTLAGDTLQFIAKNQGIDVWATFDLDVGDDGADSDDFIQAVAVVDLDNDELVFFINGEPAGTIGGTGGNIEDWAGSDAAALGGFHGNNVGGSNGTFGNMDGYANFSGMIANVNVYSGTLNATEVMAAYRAVALPEPATLALVAIGAGLLRRRRR